MDAIDRLAENPRPAATSPAVPGTDPQASPGSDHRAFRTTAEPGWRALPSWYQLARHDNAIPPQAQRFMAKRMGSDIEEIDGSHTAFIAQPVRTAAFINKAAGHT